MIHAYMAIGNTNQFTIVRDVMDEKNSEKSSK
jgi:hypothetical protein